LRRRRAGRGSRPLDDAGRVVRRAAAAAAVIVAASVWLGAQTPAPAADDLKVEITSPLGRTGLSGAIRIVARITAPPKAVLGHVQFFVDGVLVGEDRDGPPYAVEWADKNPYERREITVQVSDGDGRAAKDVVRLEPMELRDETSISSVLLEPLVLDPKSKRWVGGLTSSDFKVFEDGVEQTLDTAAPDRVPATYTLLIDSSQSMSRRMDFVREAARELPGRIRPVDQVVVAPFSRSVGPVTGPTRDRDTIVGAIDSIRFSGGTAILDALADAAKQMSQVEGHHVIVLITDGYDEHSSLDVDKSLAEIKASNATVFVIAIGGVAGISLDGEQLLNKLANDSGGRAFFPAREFQLNEIHGLIADDVQLRYLVTYTPKNQKLDGTWRSITVKTSNPDYEVKVKSGYFAPSPPPIKPQLELVIRDTTQELLDISADDLEVIEDGVPQQIEVFQESNAPVTLALLIDSSGSMRRDAPTLIEAATTFVKALPIQDKLALMLFSDKAEFAHDFSVMRPWSLDAIQKYQASGGTALWDALVAAFSKLKSVDTRRAVVVMTDGRDEDNPGTGPGSKHTFDDVLKGLEESQATVFAIGLGPNVDRERLEQIAKVSGGTASFPERVAALDGDYKRIVENLRRRYTLSYTSTNPAHDGAWRKVEVRTKRDGLIVQSKGGYFAPAGK
ncbi:MAG TPA: VWA domain-containing protein, partial [Vicinamibacterales bacterium]|nr:VWA domain-containing protein [Vicinamibacterales bacterium]